MKRQSACALQREFRGMTVCRMNVWLKTALGLGVAWALAAGAIHWLHASQPTAASITAYLAHTDVSAQSGREREKTIHRLESQLNDVTFDETPAAPAQRRDAPVFPRLDAHRTGRVSRPDPAHRFPADDGSLQQDGAGQAQAIRGTCLGRNEKNTRAKAHPRAWTTG